MQWNALFILEYHSKFDENTFIHNVTNYNILVYYVNTQNKCFNTISFLGSLSINLMEFSRFLCKSVTFLFYKCHEIQNAFIFTFV